MGNTRHRKTKYSASRERKHVLSERVITRRILFYAFLKKFRSTLIYSLVSVLLVLLTWAVFNTARHLYTRGQGFGLTEVKITPPPTQSSFFTYKTLPKLAGLYYGDSIFSFTLEEIEENLKQYPEVKDAQLFRHLPGQIEVSLKERIPIAKLSHNGIHYLVNNSGYCFQSKLASPALWATLPSLIPLYTNDITLDAEHHRLEDIGMQRALSLITEWQSHKMIETLISIEVKNYHSLEAVTTSGSQLTFGYYEHARQIKDLNSILAHCIKTGKGIESVNLIPFKNIPVAFNNNPVRPQSQPLTVETARTSSARTEPARPLPVHHIPVRTSPAPPAPPAPPASATPTSHPPIPLTAPSHSTEGDLLLILEQG